MSVWKFVFGVLGGVILSTLIVGILVYWAFGQFLGNALWAGFGYFVAGLRDFKQVYEVVFLNKSIDET